MKTKLLGMLLLAMLLACSSANTGSGGNAAPSDDYGYSQKNPIKVGGVSNGPANERKYLERLTGPNGEKVSFVRRGSCCHFETKNSGFGMGMLDIYEVEINGDSIKKTLYLNMYDKDKLYAPKGFLLKD